MPSRIQKSKTRKLSSRNQRRGYTIKRLKPGPSSKFYTRKNSKASKRKSRSVFRRIGGVIPNSESSSPAASPNSESSSFNQSPNSESSPVNLSPNSESSPFKELSDSELSHVKESSNSEPLTTKPSPEGELPAPITETAEDEPASSSEELEKDRIAPFIKEKQESIWPFFNKPLSERIRTSLDKICPISRQCISFGLETEKTRKYFNDYDLSLVDTSEIDILGGVSANGFIFEIPFVKDGYKAYAVLKNARMADADNLFYEGLVGLYVNKKNYIFPCFVETYGIYMWTDLNAHKDAVNYSQGKTLNPPALDKLKNLRKHFSYKAFFEDSLFAFKTCDFAQAGVVLVQHIHKARSIKGFINEFKGNKAFCTFHLPQYLYQVYAPLGMLSNEFNHYDLHTDNVVLYRIGDEQANRDRLREIAVGGVPNNGQYITMKYHYPGGEIVSFNTFDIAKMIDYGRSYFWETDRSFYKVYNPKTDKPSNALSYKVYSATTDAATTDAATDTPYDAVMDRSYNTVVDVKYNAMYNSNNYHQFLRSAIEANDDKRTTKHLPSNREEEDYTKRQCHNLSYDELEDEGIYGSYHYICSNKRNKSHDLRLVSMIRRNLLNEYKNKEANWVATYFDDNTDKSEEKKLVKKMLEALYYKDEYRVKRGYKEEGYGTPEVDGLTYNGLDTLESEASIRNVEDMHLALKDLLRTEYFQQMNTELFKTYQKIGEMNIYMDGSKSLQYTVEGSKI